MENFYGGRRGASFVVVKQYPSIQDMVTVFQQGGNYTDVNYDEYVLINTENKNDPDNGKLYRRGYSYSDEVGGAQYVGQIVGPAGPAPHLEFTTIEEVKNIQETEGFENRYGEGSYAPTVNLIPGKVGDKYNDAIQWAYCSVRDINAQDTTAHIGFIFPYMVTEYEASTVDPYYNRDNESADFTNTDLVTRLDDATHPYYQKWHIDIPKGIKGDAFKSLRVMQADNTVQDYVGKDDDIAKARNILVYDYYHYDKDAGGEPVSLYLGDYNTIKQIQLADDGTLTISYSHDDDTIFENAIRWIDTINLSSGGVLTFNYNTGESVDMAQTIKWIDNMNFADDGTITVDYNNGTPQQVFNKLIKWIDAISLSADGKLTFDYNTGETAEMTNIIKWIDKIKFDSPSGEFYVDYNTGEHATLGADLKWVTSINFSAQTGLFDVTYSTGESQTLATGLKWIKTVSIAADGQITVTYSDDSTENLTSKIKWITNTNLSSDGILTVTYNDGTQYIAQDKIKWITNSNLSADGTFTITYNDNSEYVSDSKVKWIKDAALGNDGTFDITYNDDTHFTKTNLFKWITDLTLSDAGEFRVKYNNGAADFVKTIKWPSSIAVADNGTVTITYNDSTTTEYDKLLRTVKSLEVDTGATEGTGTQKLKATYSGGETKLIGNPINYIMETAIRPDDYHYLVYYSDPVHRAAGANITYNGKAGWDDLGALKEESGILIGLNLERSHFTDTSNAGIIAQLNTEYPNGLPANNTDLHGKIVCVGNSDANKHFFAFDYAKTSWFFVGTLEKEAGILAGTESDATLTQKFNDMPNGTVWLIVEE